MTRKVFDCFIFFDELDLTDIRFRELADVVDHFVVVEATKTFRGEPKPLHFKENMARWDDLRAKIIHVVVDNFPEGASAWDREDWQREAILRGLTSAGPDDYIILGDCDEIADPRMVRECIKADTNGPNLFLFGVREHHFKLNWYCQSNLERVLLGPRMLRRRHLKRVRSVRKVMQKRSASAPRWMEKLIWTFYSMRSYGALLQRNFVHSAAWHFTSVKEPAAIHKKITSYAHDWKEEMGWEADEAGSISRLSDLIAEKRDAFGRPVTVAPLRDMPAVVAANPARYAHMLDIEGIPAATTP